jgi:cbb3-type cytochrome oxidase subunit 3
MRFSDIIGALNISTYPQVALLIFIGVFIAVSARLFIKGTREQYEVASGLPLDEAPVRGDDQSSKTTRLQETLP